MNLEALGWQLYDQGAFTPYAEQGFSVGRVALEHKRMYRIYTEYGELLGEVAGKLRYAASGRDDYPAVGDWVAVRPQADEQKAIIHAVLPRKSKFSRKVAGGTTEEQIVAANVDTVFLVNALNHDYNVRRMERYLILAWESGANPVIVLSKADLCDDIERKRAEVASIAPGVPIHFVSSEWEHSVDEIAPYFAGGATVALLGSSGAGKSTLINRLLGKERQRTQEVRQGDDRGKHTTTHRELIMLPQGGLVIDTPGMRELQLWEADEGLHHAFADVEHLAEQCRYRDCQHRNEPGCAIKQAIEEGALSADRYHSYLKLQKELAYLARKEDARLQLAEKQKWKKIHMALRERPHKRQ